MHVKIVVVGGVGQRRQHQGGVVVRIHRRQFGSASAVDVFPQQFRLSAGLGKLETGGFQFLGDRIGITRHHLGGCVGFAAKVFIQGLCDQHKAAMGWDKLAGQQNVGGGARRANDIIIQVQRDIVRVVQFHRGFDDVRAAIGSLGFGDGHFGDEWLGGVSEIDFVWRLRVRRSFRTLP